MVITLSADLESALKESARRQGMAPEELAINALRAQFLGPAPSSMPQNEWERILLGAATDCGVSLPHSALTSDGLYE